MVLLVPLPRKFSFSMYFPLSAMAAAAAAHSTAPSYRTEKFK